MLTIFMTLIPLATADAAGDEWLARVDETARVEDAHLLLDVP